MTMQQLASVSGRSIGAVSMEQASIGSWCQIQRVDLAVSPAKIVGSYRPSAASLASSSAGDSIQSFDSSVQSDPSTVERPVSDESPTVTETTVTEDAHQVAVQEAVAAPVFQPIIESANARVDLLGNQSDEFNGEALLFSLKNFEATVTLQPGQPGIRFIPHPVHDSNDFMGFEDLDEKVESMGYYGGLRLLKACCKQFFLWCRESQIELGSEALPGFSISYDSNIPRQAGLAGSSAMLCATLRALMRYYNVELPPSEQAGLLLSMERELGIASDLQDKVVQVFGGLMHMVFSDEELVTKQGCGTYRQLNAGSLPPLYLMYAQEGSNTADKLVHLTIQHRWLGGDQDVVSGMESIAACAREGRAALEKWDVGSLAKLMNRNFELKRGLYGDEGLGVRNIRMVELAQEFGCAAKTCGSGGAVVVLCPRGKPQVQELEAAAAMEGFHLVPAEVARM